MIAKCTIIFGTAYRTAFSMILNDESAVAEMLSRYGFELGGQTAPNLVRAWSRVFDPSWLLPAVIETLDRGRYKAASVEQVLAGWKRRGEAKPRFNSEFAAMVLSKIDASPMLLDDGDLNESLLDAEITSFTELAIEDTVASVFNLSNPALDLDEEGSGEESKPRSATVFSSAVTPPSLIPSNYPPLPLRKPNDCWEGECIEDRSRPPLLETFTPSTQVSQFYYRLLAMAATVPAQNSDTQALQTTSPMLAEG
jgi:hypothetical protein